MDNIDKVLEEIIRNIFSDQPNIFSGPMPPRVITMGRDKSIFISQAVESKISLLADLMYKQDIMFSETHSEKEWKAIVKFAIGRSLRPLDHKIDDFEVEAQKLRKSLNKTIKNYTSLYGDLKTAYGCWLFTPPPVESIKIGPVSFEDKSTWLYRNFESGESLQSTNFISSHEFAGKFPEEREPSYGKQHEEDIRNQISDTPMVCEVLTHGLATELAYKRSMIAAHLAMTSISLIWSRPSSILKRFRIALDGKPRCSYNFLMEPKNRKLISSQFAKQSCAYDIPREMWTERYSKASCFLKIAGEVIGCWTSTKTYEAASPLLIGLSQSLFFFWKACKEESNILSIIEFVATLETLSPGRNKSGIFELIEARLGINKKHKLTEEKTLGQIVDEIYGTARSRTLHGTNPKLHYDWSNTRAIAEQIATGCLVKCMIMAQDRWCDKKKDFLLTDPVTS